MIRSPRQPTNLTVAEAFDARANSIGFLRWLLAFLVIFSHAGPIAGFYDGEDLGVQVSSEQSLGGVAVAGFFFFSGFLVTGSRMGRSSTLRYFWRRSLRIFPAFWLALSVTAFVLAPLVFWHRRGTLSGFFGSAWESPLTYVPNNMWLVLNQRNIAGLGDAVPFADFGGRDWNGSAWTLQYEFKAYLLVGVLGLFGALAHRAVGTAVAVAIIAVNAMTWSGIGDLSAISPVLADPYNAMLLAPFAAGVLVALWPEKIRVDDRLALLGLVVAAMTYAVGGWNIWGQYGLLYFLLWFAIRATRLNNWERFGDFSYGVYIFAWPFMYAATFFGLQDAGWLVFHLVIVVAVHVAAFCSWHLIEKPAMSLKDWTPRWWVRVSAGLGSAVAPLTRKFRDPRFSSLPPRPAAAALDASGDDVASSTSATSPTASAADQPRVRVP